VLPLVDLVLRRAGAAPDDVEAFAVSVGPGSFTGLRVGIATVKGLAFGSGRPVAAVSSLRALARRAPAEASVAAALLDARRGEVYGAAYALPAPLPRELVAEGVYRPEELGAKLSAEPGLALVGEGALLHAEALRAALPEARLVPDASAPRARDVGVLGARHLARGEGIAAEELVPRYLRRAEAEVRRTGMRFE